jgi:hypothetical protein
MFIISELLMWKYGQFEPKIIKNTDDNTISQSECKVLPVSDWLKFCDVSPISSIILTSYGKGRGVLNAYVRVVWQATATLLCRNGDISNSRIPAKWLTSSGISWKLSEKGILVIFVDFYQRLFMVLLHSPQQKCQQKKKNLKWSNKLPTKIEAFSKLRFLFFSIFFVIFAWFLPSIPFSEHDTSEPNEPEFANCRGILSEWNETLRRILGMIEPKLWAR